MIEPAGDLNRDGVPDLIARNANGDLLMYALTRSPGIKAGVPVGAVWPPGPHARGGNWCS